MNNHIDSLTDVFRKSATKHEAHKKVVPIMEEMAGDAAFLSSVFSKHFKTPNVLNARHYPVVSMNIEQNSHYVLVANCWIPLPDKATDVSTKAIHHHGDMLLTTATAFGPGYEHWLFTKPRQIDAEHELFTMELSHREQHPAGHIAFVDADLPHLPLYMSSLTITLALWSSKKMTSWKDHVKRMPLLNRNSEALRKVAAKAGLAKQLDLKVVDYKDYFPTPEGFKGMKDRVEFERGPNEDHLHCLFYILQQTGNEKLAPLVEERLNGAEAVKNAALVKKLLDDLRQGQTIESRLSEGHYNIPFANFSKADIERAFEAQQARTGNLVPA